MKRASLVIFLSVALSVSIIVTVLYLNFRSLERDVINHEMVVRSFEAISTSKDLLKNVSDAESYKTAIIPFEQSISKLKKLTAGNPVQQLRSDTLKLLCENRFANFAKRMYSVTNNEDQLAASGEGKMLMDEIRVVVARFIEKEQEQLDLLKKETETSNRNSFIILLIGAGAIFIILGFLFSLLYKENKERKISEQQLFIRNEWFNQTLVSLGDGVIATDTNGVITLINKAACELSGWKEEEAIGNHIDKVFEITNERTGLKVINPLMEALQQNKVMLLANHTILKRKNGGALFIDDSGAPIHNEAGEVIGAVLIFRDITEKKKAEDEVVSSNKRFTTIFNISPVGLAISSFDDGRFMYVNDAYCKTLRFKRDELVGKKSIDLNIMDAETRERLMQRIQEADGYAKDVESKVGKSNGEMLDCLYSITKLEVDNKQCIVTALVDISERKKAEKQLKLMNETLEKRVEERTEELNNQKKFSDGLLESAPDSIVGINEKGEIILFNKQAEVFFGYERNEIIGERIEKLMPDRFYERHVAYRNDYFDQPSNRNMEGRGVFLGKRKNGEEFPVDISLSYLQTLTQKIAIASIRDITERKKAEEEIIRKNIELQKTNSALDRFVYSASHDLRAPLTSLLGLINITDKNLPPDQHQQKERLRMMGRSVLKLDNFISDILDYSRNSRTEVAKDEISFEAMITEIREHLKFMEVESGYNLKGDVNQKGKFISDKSRIGIVMNNLVSNAIKYQDISKENPFVSISIQADETNAIIVIEDNGIGIAEDDHEKIFEMFYRATKTSKGSGLGLYILKESLDKLNGTISLESAINKGSKFTVIIPNLI